MTCLVIEQMTYRADGTRENGHRANGNRAGVVAPDSPMYPVKKYLKQKHFIEKQKIENRKKMVEKEFKFLKSRFDKNPPPTRYFCPVLRVIFNFNKNKNKFIKNCWVEKFIE